MWPKNTWSDFLHCYSWSSLSSCGSKPRLALFQWHGLQFGKCHGGSQRCREGPPFWCQRSTLCRFLDGNTGYFVLSFVTYTGIPCPWIVFGFLNQISNLHKLMIQSSLRRDFSFLNARFPELTRQSMFRYTLNSPVTVCICICIIFVFVCVWGNLQWKRSTTHLHTVIEL